MVSATPRPGGPGCALETASVVLIALLASCSKVEPVSPPADDPADVIVRFGAPQARASDPVASFDGPTLALAWVQRAGGYAEVHYGTWALGAPPELIGWRIDQGRGNAESPAIACAAGSCLVAWGEHDGLDRGRVQAAVFETASPCRVAARGTVLGLSGGGGGPLRVDAIGDGEFLVLAEEGALVRREGDQLSVSPRQISRVSDGAPGWEIYLAGERARIMGVAPGEEGPCLGVERSVEVGCLPVSDAAHDCANSSWTESAWVRFSTKPSFYDSCDPLAMPLPAGRVDLIQSDRRQEAQVRWDVEPRPTSPTVCEVEVEPAVDAPVAIDPEPESEPAPARVTEPQPIQLVEKPTEPQTEPSTIDPPPDHGQATCPRGQLKVTVHKGPAREKCVKIPKGCSSRPTCACLDGKVCPQGTCWDVAPREIACMISR